ncbi:MULTISPECIES: homocitrate synthase [Clostridium]|uniref:homocitrate synthase n=1 Tax=Clostridium TaxID=1485 RepID=UPI000826836E|nr:MULTISPECIES: homocitrate synthase [Clostridium]PJI08099.1 homocitrate synthase [Clostridium sp. CT7]
MKINLVDTTLRDGEQKAGIALNVQQKIEIAKLLDSMGVFQIEAGAAIMGGYEKTSIKKIVELGLKSKISSWNRMNLKDIKQSIDCNVDIIHISVPASEIQIKYNLKKSKKWIMDNLKRCIYYAKSSGYEVTVGLEDASRADIKFLIKLCNIVYKEGVRRVRYADTVGILYPRKAYKNISTIIKEVPVEIEMHAHNDFGMAEANSIGAVKGGAKYIDTTIGGIGERAGNCNYIKFLKAFEILSKHRMVGNEFFKLKKQEKSIINLLKISI